MTLKLFQDHFIDSDQFEDLGSLYDACNKALAETVVAYEVITFIIVKLSEGAFVVGYFLNKFESFKTFHLLTLMKT